MDVSQKLDEISAAVNGARSMPMSASCVVNRAELLAKLEEAREALPGSLAQAEELLGGREQMVAEAESEARRIIESAQAERGSLVSGTEIARGAQEEADRILAKARQEAEEVRAEADYYVDSKLANFEVVLSKTIGSVERGREKLLGSGPGAEEWNEDFAEDAPERTADPQALRERADTYVDARLGSVSAVLAKTMEAVGRGRLTLQGAQSSDELGAHMSAQDEAGHVPHTSDADYLADLAAMGGMPAETSVDPAAPAAPGYPEQAAAQTFQQVPGQQPFEQQPYQQEPIPQPVPDADPYAVQQGGYPGQDPYYGQGYGQDYGQDPYGYQQQNPYYGGQQQDLYYAPHPDYAPQPPQQMHYQDQQLQGPPAQPPVPAQMQAGPQLDETSLFDTSMIDLDQVRRYEQEQGYGR